MVSWEKGELLNTWAQCFDAQWSFPAPIYLRKLPRKGCWNTPCIWQARCAFSWFLDFGRKPKQARIWGYWPLSSVGGWEDALPTGETPPKQWELFSLYFSGRKLAACGRRDLA